MPHFNAQGQDTWVCQKGGHICSGHSTWIDRGSDLAKQIGCHGNVCQSCLQKAVAVIPAAVNEPTEPPVKPPMSLHEYCSYESGFPRGSRELENYINRYYGHG